MRPMGSPWKYAVDKLYAHASALNPGYLSNLPDDYWISEEVLVRLQAIVDSDSKIRWSSSVKSKGPAEVDSYAALQ